MDEDLQASLRQLPAVERVLQLLGDDPIARGAPRSVVVEAVRACLGEWRQGIRRQSPQGQGEQPGSMDRLLERVRGRIAASMGPNLRPVVNGTGVVVHTNLGRSPLAKDACRHIEQIASGYSNLEFDLAAGKRGSRYNAVEGLLCELTGAESALVVNNNAGAVLLCLSSVAKGKEVVVSRGELVEIGGSFRIPDVMIHSGAILVEVGTTNRTHLKDYETAIGVQTALLLKAHTSNYSIVGFTASVPLEQLVQLAAGRGILVMEDLGSGSLLDLSAFGLAKEPTVPEAVGTGADLVTFSGDKILGGPQAGIIVGKEAAVDRVKRNPIHRALRIDKLTLAALEWTLRLYRDPAAAVATIPTLRMLTARPEEVGRRAAGLARRLLKIGDPRLTVRRERVCSRVGGGALPLHELPSHAVCIGVEGITANGMERLMLGHATPIVGRIEKDAFLLDARTIRDEEFDTIVAAVAAVLAGTP